MKPSICELKATLRMNCLNPQIDYRHCHDINSGLVRCPDSAADDEKHLRSCQSGRRCAVANTCGPAHGDITISELAEGARLSIELRWRIC